MKVCASLDYTKVRQIGIGKGLNSKVFLIDDHQLAGTLVAKEIPKSDFPAPDAFFKEAQRVFLAAHPNVVPIQYACAAGPDHVSLVMPYFRNGSLADKIENGPLTEKETVRVGVGVLAGLAHIHSKNLVHFDVKPSNVLFSDAAEPMVADFGQTRELGPLGISKAPPLYPNAFPPEVYAGGVGTVQTDVFHVGLLLYRAVNGEPHYSGQVPADDVEHKRKTLKGKFPDRTRFMPHVARQLRVVIRKALRVAPSQRYATATQMASALGRVQLGPPWQVTVVGNETTWTWERDPAPQVIVRLRQSGTLNSVDVYTLSGSAVARQKDSKKFKRSGLGADAAWKHLNDVVFPSFR
jgi:eukaryotic-like serine/threonine-protein kinase